MARIRSAAALLVGLTLAGSPAGAGLLITAPETRRVSVSSTGDQGTSHSRDPSLSGTGRYVAFESTASNLVTGDTNGASDVFVHDVARRSTARVSVSSSGVEANGSSATPTISANGRFVAFRSFASNLVGSDTNGEPDIFVHDLLLHRTERVSVRHGSGQANASSRSPAISADGRYVAFSSSATNLVDGDTNGAEDVFVRDRLARTTTRESVTGAGAQADGASGNPTIAADGTVIAFDSVASNLGAGDTRICFVPGFPFPTSRNCLDIFARDRTTGAVEWVTAPRFPSAADWSPESIAPALSGDGRYVAFESGLDNLIPGDTNERTDVYVYDRQAGSLARASVAPGGAQAENSSHAASLSADGRFLAFSSHSILLVPGDTNGKADIFVRDLLLGVTQRASISTLGMQGTGAVQHLSIAGDGRSVAFGSGSPELVLEDTNGSFDVLVRLLGGAWLTI